MPATQVTGRQIGDGTVQRADLDIATVGQAVIRKIVQGTGVTITSTGADSGTGDVTINAAAGSGGASGAWKDPVKAATTAALPANTRSGNVLTASANGAFPSQDGIQVFGSERVLVKNEAAAANNGIYVLTTVGDASTPWSLTRATDADTAAKLTINQIVIVNYGTKNMGIPFAVVNAVTTINVDNVTFVPQQAGTPLVETNGSTSPVLRTQLSADTADRLVINGYGEMRWGNGTNALDVILSRVSGILTGGPVGAPQSIVLNNDSRMTNARTPTAHAASHASAGADPVTLAESQVTNLVGDLASKAPLAAPAFTGVPTAPTAASGTNTTQLATTAFVAAAVVAPLDILTWGVD